MTTAVPVLVGIASIFMTMYAYLIRTFFKTRDKSNLYFGISCFLWALAAVFGILIAAATAYENSSLAELNYRISTTLGVSGYLFLSLFAVAVTKPEKKMRGIWIPLAAFLIITFIVWAFEIHVEGVVDGMTQFTLTSTYKEPRGMPFIEIIIALMAMIAIVPISLFFRVAKDTKERITRIKSLLIGIGMAIATMAYAIVTIGVILYQYMLVYMSLIFIGSFMMLLGHFIYPSAPSIKGQIHAFSKTLRLNHQQMVGKKILLEFDPTSHYEKAIHNFVAEALANAEKIIVFTRKSSTIHSSLHEEKAVKFFCSTQQVSVPKEISENEVLLPSGDTSLMLSVLDKTLKAYPQSAINVVFDLSDLVLSIGFDKTYLFLKYAVEILASPRNTVLFLLNQTAHDPKVTSSLRSLFSDQISFGKEGIQTVKLSKAEAGTLEIREKAS
jgi:hypothetical protein